MSGRRWDAWLGDTRDGEIPGVAWRLSAKGAAMVPGTVPRRQRGRTKGNWVRVTRATSISITAVVAGALVAGLLPATPVLAVTPAPGTGQPSTGAIQPSTNGTGQNGSAANGPATSGPVPNAKAPTTIKWGPCEDPRLQKAKAECGYLPVPLDYSQPGGKKISLAVSRIKHTVSDDKFQGVMLTNPGGPGASGLGLATLGKGVPNGAGESYDWIGFDPRGVGSSKPGLSCVPNYAGYNRPPYVPKTKQIEQAWLNRAKSYAAACQKSNKDLFANLKTTDTAKDLESIRVALGQEQINYYGFSYGTYLGQVYGTLFPNRLRRVVLDANVDPRKVWYQANLDQDIAFEKNIKNWFRWVAKYDKVFHLGTTAIAVEAQYYKQLDALTKKPASGVIGPDEWTDVFLQAAYYQVGWVEMAQAFSAWVTRKDIKPVKTLYDGNNAPGDDNGYAVYNGVQCSDVQWPTNWSKWRKDNWLTHARAPFETWANAWYNAPCAFWGSKAGTPVKVDGSKVKDVLLIGETSDAATPYAGSLEVRKRFPNARLVTTTGGVNHAYSLNGNECVDLPIAEYLSTGKLPARKAGQTADLSCKPLPEPDPSKPEKASPRKELLPEIGLPVR